MKPTLIMAAVPRELELLVSALEEPYRDPDTIFPATEGTIGGRRLSAAPAESARRMPHQLQPHWLNAIVQS